MVLFGLGAFRGFDLMKSVKGNREMHGALGLDPFLDPLHSSGLRKFASERDALYEEVSYMFCYFVVACAFCFLGSHLFCCYETLD